MHKEDIHLRSCSPIPLRTILNRVASLGFLIVVPLHSSKLKHNDSLTPIRNMVVNWHRLFSIAGCVEATTFGEELRGPNNVTLAVVNLGLSWAMLERRKLE